MDGTLLNSKHDIDIETVEAIRKAEEKGIIASVMIFILADLLIKWKFLISGVLFLIGHILLIVCFCMEKKPTRKGIAVWAVLTVAEAPLMIRLLGQYGFSPAVGCARSSIRIRTCADGRMCLASGRNTCSRSDHVRVL